MNKCERSERARRVLPTGRIAVRAAARAAGQGGHGLPTGGWAVWLETGGTPRRRRQGRWA
ncbi:hypothetical protein SLA_3653 [Streptomyces laurentii]|uniref:Uncharacterized protein n=1 Tax=Streptomyces laurentii TaxID=39478 RepID=A0A160P2B9_STRLU|nr:hypothetical protein SLA_3653 [Streptomyces laurentii]